MKKYVALMFILTLLSVTSQAQVKFSILEDVKNYKLEMISGAMYKFDHTTMYDSVKSFLSKEYAITSVSTNGIIKGEARGKLRFNNNISFETNYFIEAYIRGNSPYQINFIQWEERRSERKSTGEISDWRRIDKPTEKLNILFYEKMHGPIKLPKSLKDRIDAYNNNQPTDNLKLQQGRDY